MSEATKLTGLPARGLSPLAVVRAIVESRLLGKHRPFWVNVELTHRCNLRCTFCDKRDEAREMPAMRARALLAELRANGTASVCFDGGEPLCHPDIGSIVPFAKSLGLRVALSTNGTRLGRFRHLLAYLDAVKISVDGPPEVHDRGRGAPSFHLAMQGARLAVAAGVPVALRMTMANHNVDHWPFVLELAERIGAAALFQPAIGSVMDAHGARGPHGPDRAAYRRAIDELVRRKRLGRPVGNEHVCLEHLRRFPEPALVRRCAGGRVEVAIGPDGSMYPCGRVGRHEPAPNVLELGVAEAFARVRRPERCAACWCTLTLGNCYLYALDPRLLRGRVRF